MARNKHPEETLNRILKVSTRLFMEKGYEHTTIQDIISELGNLSKGAIYHHFASKEDIMEAVCDQFFNSSTMDIMALLNQKNMTGLEKMRMAFKISLNNPKQEELLHSVPDLMKNPKFLTKQLYESISMIAPQVIEPLIRQGITDGSITASDPREAAQFLLLLTNVWMNPSIFHMTQEEMRSRFLYVKRLLELIGFPGLLDDEIWKTMDHYRSFLSVSNT